MEIVLLKPTLHWRSLSRKPNHRRHKQQDMPADLPSAEHVSGFVTLESDPQEQRHLPCTLSLPASDAKEYPAFLTQSVTFHVFSKGDTSAGRDGELLLLSKHSRPLRECVPVLTDAKVAWSDTVTWKQTELELDVTVPVVTNREPRQLVEKLICYKGRAYGLAEQLSLHRNVVAVGLLPPILGCFIGVIATSPVWVPLTIFVAILGSPLWFVVAIGLSLVIVFSTISTLITVQVVRSKHLKQELERFLQGPHGQLLLFRGASPDEGKLKQLVMSDPKYKLVASLLIDFVGNATFVLPVIGELADLLWAPLAASMVSGMYSESSPNIKYFAFMEEVLPFTDFIPTATLACPIAQRPLLNALCQAPTLPRSSSPSTLTARIVQQQQKATKMLMANKCDAPIRRADPVCQSSHGGDTAKQFCDLLDAPQLHGHHHHHHILQHHSRNQQKKQEPQSHMTLPMPARRLAMPPDAKHAYVQAQAADASSRPLRSAKAPPMPFLDEMLEDGENNGSMAQFRSRFDAGEFFLHQQAGDRAAQLSRSA